MRDAEYYLMITVYLLVFAGGLLAGSFLRVCICRIPEGRTLAALPLKCDRCGERSRLSDLIPVAGCALSGGKCRKCGSPVASGNCAVEILTGVAYVLLLSKYSITFEFAVYAYLVSILIAVLFIDIDRRIIPDGLVLAGLAGGIPIIVRNFFSPMAVYGNDGWWSPLLGILPGAGFLFLAAIAGIVIYKTDDAMGMGDVKLFAAIGPYLGWRMCITALLLSVFAAGLTSMALVLTGIKKRRDTIPFGPFIVIGTFVTVMWGMDILRWYAG